jgi:prolyl-tRNA synthetase
MGVEVILDDRQDRLGGKLKDADLIGIPLQIIVGQKNLEEGKMEIKIRKTQESQLHPYPQIVNDIPNILKDL